MKINNQHYETLWLSEKQDSIQIIDQRKLPFEFVIEELKTIKQVYTAIEDMWVRGAPLIGATAALGVYLVVRNWNQEEKFDLYLNKRANYLKSARPTAVNLAFAIDEVVAAVKETDDHEERKQKALQAALAIVDNERQYCKQIGEHGVELIREISQKKKGEIVNILTHCNAGWLACVDYGTATAPIYFAHDAGLNVHVWVDETRPRNQGARLTAWELGQHGVPHTIIPDNTGGHLMQHGMVDIVIVGSDRTTVTGDVANKIGTYLKALAAKDNHVPFYAALPSSTIDWNLSDGVKEIPIEQRATDEVVFMEGLGENKQVQIIRITPEHSPAVNYGFDVTPARLVSGIITERGVCEANKESILTLYPEKR